jgi:COP9 signalosome complex subunit 7
VFGRQDGAKQLIVRLTSLYPAAMDLGTKHAAKLEPFLLMAKSIKGAAAAKLIQDATSAPGVFVFAELLELPNIQEVRSQQRFSV